MSMSKKIKAARRMTDKERWAALNDWLTHSEKRRLRLAEKLVKFVARDPASLKPTEFARAVRLDHTVDDWACDRQVLEWALAHTPATSPRAILVKARAAQAGLGKDPEELAKTIVRNFLATWVAEAGPS